MAMGRKNTPLMAGGGLDAGNSSISSYSSSHSIVVPVGHKQTIPALEKRRKIVDTSTWMPGMVYNRDFQTVTGASYVDPSLCSIGQDVHEAQIEEAQLEWEKARSIQRKDARDKLAGLAKSKFGNMSNMLKAVRSQNIQMIICTLLLNSNKITRNPSSSHCLTLMRHLLTPPPPYLSLHH